MRYTNFDLHLSRDSDGGYLVAAVSGSFGEVSAPLQLNYDSAPFKARLARMADGKTDQLFLADLGNELLKALLPGDVGECFQRSVGLVADNPDRGLRIRFLVHAPELASIPWELIYSALDRTHLATSIASPVLRYITLPAFKRSLGVDAPLAILVASPRTSLLANAAVEENIITKSIGQMGDIAKIVFVHQQSSDGLVTWPAVEKLVAEHSFNVFHFIGHGHFESGSGWLELDDGPIIDTRIADLFVNSPALSLAVLNSCEGAISDQSDFLTGTAATLVGSGVPAVVAMQYEILDEAAAIFCQSFYHSLFQGHEAGRVEHALSVARQSLIARYKDEREFCTPVLFTHTEECMLFLDNSASLLSSRSLDTLHTAGNQMLLGNDPVEPQAQQLIYNEQASIARKLQRGKLIAKSGFVVGAMSFILAWIGFLDIFYLETGSEFASMALGDAFADHELDPSLRVVQLNYREPAQLAEQRNTLSGVIDRLANAGAAVVVVDSFYNSDENGGFESEPASGQQLADSMAAAAEVHTKVVVALDPVNGTVPIPLAAAQVAAGHACTESRLGLARSLPIEFDDQSGNTIRAMAAEALFAFREASPDISKSEREARSVNDSDCKFIDDDFTGNTDIGFRLIRLSPLDDLRGIELREREFDRSTLDSFAGKLVVVGTSNKDDIIDTIWEKRPGYLWQVDAINNLLQDIMIKRVPAGLQFLILVFVAIVSIGTAHRFRRYRALRLLVPAMMVLILFLLCSLLYARTNWLLNPANLITATIGSWFLYSLYEKYNRRYGT